MDHTASPTIAQAALEVINLKVSFGEKLVLSDVTFSLEAQKTLAILGPGSSGKTTILKTILGILPSQQGHIYIRGQHLQFGLFQQRRQLLRNVAMAFQLGALFDFMTVRENILFAMENCTHFELEEREKRTQDYLNQVGLIDALHKFPSELSGGMRRRVGIVRAMVTAPQIALLDEPTAGLDPVTSTLVIDMIHSLAAASQSALLCVTSSVDVAFSFAKEVAILKDGMIVARGSWEQLQNCGDEWVTHFLNIRGFKPL